MPKLLPMATVLLLTACASLAPRELAQQRAVDACRDKIAATPLLPLLSSPKKIDGYCQCAGERLVSGLGNSELLEVASKGKALLDDPKWQGRLLNSGLQCLPSLMQ